MVEETKPDAPPRRMPLSEEQLSMIGHEHAVALRRIMGPTEALTTLMYGMAALLINEANGVETAKQNARAAFEALENIIDHNAATIERLVAEDRAKAAAAE